MPQRPEPGSLFLVERYLPGVTEKDLAATLKGAVLAAGSLSGDHHHVRYVACTLIPADEVVLCLFRAESAKIVAQLNQQARMSFDRIVSAVDVVIPPWEQLSEPPKAET